MVDKAVCGLSDSDPYSRKVFKPNQAFNASHSVMRSRRTVHADSERAAGQIYVIIYYNKFIMLRFVPFQKIAHCPSGIVHKRFRFCKHNARAAEPPLAVHGAEPFFVYGNIQPFRYSIDCHKPDIVTRFGVFPARVAQPDYNKHRFLPVARKLLSRNAYCNSCNQQCVGNCYSSVVIQISVLRNAVVFNKFERNARRH